MVLAPTNAQSDSYNHDGLSALGTPERIFRGETKGEFHLLTTACRYLNP